MSRMKPFLLSLLSLAVSARGQNTLADPVAKLLPNDARVIETADVIVPGKARTLVLWIKAPKRVAATWDSGPDFLYGDHWSGPANLSGGLIYRSAAQHRQDSPLLGSA